MSAPGQPLLSRPRAIPHLRWWIGGLLFASTVINYIDRQTLALLAPFLTQDYHWTHTDYANLLISFRIAYALGQTACGRFIDRVGTRRGLSISVLWYSFASIVTSLASGFRSFAVFRFCWERENPPTGPAPPRRCPSGFPDTSVLWRVRCSTAARRLAELSRLSLFCQSTFAGDGDRHL
jgi:ACS family hexuronate transporter-like MFS transporter